MKTSGAGVNRSRLYYLMNPIAPINHALKARFDVFGAVATIGLLVAGVSLIRLLLSWVQ